MRWRTYQTLCLVMQKMTLDLQFLWELEKSCFFDDYPMIQSGQIENVNLHVYRFGSYFFRKYEYSCIYESPTSPNFTSINLLFHSHNLCHAPILYYSSPIIAYSALLIPLQYLLILLSRTKI